MRLVTSVNLVFAALSLTAASSVAAEQSVSFVNDIVPVLTKAGCNTGVCHAKAGNGQNGFELSLLGFEPDEDYDHMVREGRSRRLFPSAPEMSLLLRKASGQIPHGGGVRLPSDSEGYKSLSRWIRQGMPYRAVGDPDLVRIEVHPGQEKLQPSQQLRLRVEAHYSDGSVRDVTKWALFESNESAMADVDESGTVIAKDLPGKFAIMIRYQGLAAVFGGSIPLGAPINEANIPKHRNFVDEHVFANLRQLGIPPSPSIDDATFLRRVTLDIGGRLPTVDEVDEFLASAEPDKRERLVDQLLSSPDYADYFANKWTTVLKNRRDAQSDITSNFAFHAWIRDSLLENKPYDQLVAELLAATGTVIANPAVAWYKRVKEPKTQMEDVAQLFLGVRMQCAQCHHHPFERWSQDDYYGLTAFFSRVGRKPTSTPGEDLIFHQRGLAASKNIKTGQMIRPAALGDDVGEISAGQDPRLRLVRWLRQPENPFFAKAVVNRYWKHFFKRGLIEPEDDIRDTNPPTNPELLAALEQHFVDSGYDLKALVKAIVSSSAYQLSSQPNEHNLADRQNYSRFYPRRMQAEVMLDSIDQLTGATTSFANLPIGTRAVALPDNSYNRSSPFLRVFGRPESASVCECERVQTASLAQSLHLMNASDIKSKLRTGNGRVVSLCKPEVGDEVAVEELYRAAYSRSPTDDELKKATEYLAETCLDVSGKPLSATASKRQNMEDLVWALMNTKEFLFNH